MEFSLIDYLRSSPIPKAVGKCPACGNSTVAKCGSQKIWHWAHASGQKCDSWWENETTWHRAWKSNWLPEYREVIQFDAISGEKHIADVKNAVGVVIEFQNSAMNDAERVARERFYGNMIWIVNGAPFLKNIEIGAKLPNPDHSRSLDMCIFPSRRSDFLFHLASEDVGDSMVAAYGSHQIKDFIESTHIGHCLFTWKHERVIWYRAAAPIYFDFGGESIWRLMKFNRRSPHCIQAISKTEFITQNDGLVGSTVRS
jgi:competence protein CoiA